MTISLATNVVEQVNALPYDAAVAICKRFSIATDTVYFKTIELIRTALRDNAVREAVEREYLDHITSQYQVRFAA